MIHLFPEVKFAYKKQYTYWSQMQFSYKCSDVRYWVNLNVIPFDLWFLDF